MGRLPWFALFLRRARRLRPVLPISGLHVLENRRLVSHVRHAGEESVAVDHDATDLTGADKRSGRVNRFDPERDEAAVPGDHVGIRDDGGANR